MITSAEYYKGRDKQYASELTEEIRKNSIETIRRANALLELFYATNPNAKRDRTATSGWRPPAVNAATKKAATKSKHMLGLAIDIGDSDGKLDAWLMTINGQRALEVIGLWMEHPSATQGWCHLQTVQNRSWKDGKPRVFYP
jgi:hypothetical protein